MAKSTHAMPAYRVGRGQDSQGSGASQSQLGLSGLQSRNGLDGGASDLRAHGRLSHGSAQGHFCWLTGGEVLRKVKRVLESLTVFRVSVGANKAESARADVP